MLLSRKYFLLLAPILPALFVMASKSTVEKIPTKPVYLSNFTAQGTQRIIQIDMKNNNSATSEKEIIPITAQVSMPFDFDGELEYKWLLSENIVLVHGAANGKISQLKANKNYSLKIQVQGFSTVENRQIVLQISGNKNGRRLTADAIISSKMEDTFESIVQNVEKIKMEKRQ